MDEKELEELRKLIENESDPVVKACLERNLQATLETNELFQKSFNVTKQSIELTKDERRSKSGGTEFSMIALIDDGLDFNKKQKSFVFTGTSSKGEPYSNTVLTVTPYLPFTGVPDDIGVCDDRMTVVMDHEEYPNVYRVVHADTSLQLKLFGEHPTSGWIRLTNFRLKVDENVKNPDRPFVNFDAKVVPLKAEIKETDMFFMLHRAYGKPLPISPIDKCFWVNDTDIEDYIRETRQERVQQSWFQEKMAKEGTSLQSYMNTPITDKDLKMNTMGAMKAKLPENHSMTRYINGKKIVFHCLDKSPLRVTIDMLRKGYRIASEAKFIGPFTKPSNDKFKSKHKIAQSRYIMGGEITQDVRIFNPDGTTRTMTIIESLWHPTVVRAYGMSNPRYFEQLFPLLASKTPAIVEGNVDFDGMITHPMNSRLDSIVYINDKEVKEVIPIRVSKIHTDIVTGLKRAGFIISDEAAVKTLQTFITSNLNGEIKKANTADITVVSKSTKSVDDKACFEDELFQKYTDSTVVNCFEDPQTHTYDEMSAEEKKQSPPHYTYDPERFYVLITDAGMNPDFKDKYFDLARRFLEEGEEGAEEAFMHHSRELSHAWIQELTRGPRNESVGLKFDNNTSYVIYRYMRGKNVRSDDVRDFITNILPDLSTLKPVPSMDQVMRNRGLGKYFRVFAEGEDAVEDDFPEIEQSIEQATEQSIEQATERVAASSSSSSSSSLGEDQLKTPEASPKKRARDEDVDEEKSKKQKKAPDAPTKVSSIRSRLMSKSTKIPVSNDDDKVEDVSDDDTEEEESSEKKKPKGKGQTSRRLFKK